jgi:hypothetical protein
MNEDTVATGKLSGGGGDRYPQEEAGGDRAADRGAEEDSDATVAAPDTAVKAGAGV